MRLGVDGVFTDFSDTGVAAVASIPEPGTYVLMLAGLAGVGWVARRRAGGALGRRAASGRNARDRKCGAARSQPARAGAISARGSRRRPNERVRADLAVHREPARQRADREPGRTTTTPGQWRRL